MSKLTSGHTAEDLKEMEQYKKDFLGSAHGMVKLSPGGWIFPKLYVKHEHEYINFKFRPDDVLIMTYPKSGTTWMQEIVWTMRNNPNLDSPRANDALFSRSPFIEYDTLVGDLPEDMTPEMLDNDPMVKAMNEKFQELIPNFDKSRASMIQLSEALTGGRTLKTHLPFSLMPANLLQTCKVIFVIRNPMDAVLSFQHHCRLLKGHSFVSSQDVFVDYFIRDMILYGSFAEMIKEAWQKRGHPNLKFFYYEDMKADIDSELKRLDEFIGTGLTKQQLDNVKQHTSFSNMKASDPLASKTSPMVNQEVLAQSGGFVRQGKSGTWKDKLTEEQVKKLKKYVDENFKGTGITFKYE